MTSRDLGCGAIVALLVAASGAWVLAGCRGEPSKEPPIVPVRNMYQQPRYNPQARSAFFADGRTMRAPVPGTVAREMEFDLELQTGRSREFVSVEPLAEPGEVAGSESGEIKESWVLEVPQEVVDRVGGFGAMLARGQERYGIYCAPCHGLTGDGQGMVAKRASSLNAAALQPPSFHDGRLRSMPDGQLFATITNGLRNMPSYQHSVAVADRWAIVGFVRALQMSQGSRAQAARQEVSP